MLRVAHVRVRGTDRGPRPSGTLAGMRPTTAIAALCLATFPALTCAADLHVLTDGPAGRDDLPLVRAGGAIPVFVDPGAAAVVHVAALLLADDIGRVAGPAPVVRAETAGQDAVTVLVGTLGDGGPVDRLVTAGKVDADGVRGQWETFAWQVVSDPLPGWSRALVIVGSDRRGTAYGCTELSRAIGVSPWNWWADVPVAHHEQLAVTAGRHVEGPPGVKYRGLFLNDEDWGLRPWASKTFDPALGNLGPKTYTKLFELMLRLRLNYLWPAMHPGSAEFGSVPGNAEAADRWAVIMGASHCEPMLRNNVYWDKANGPWRYDVNRANILRYWTESVDRRGDFEAVWTLGIRGIHDAPMDGPKGTPARVTMMQGVLADQRQLIDGKVTRQYGPPAECFIPYKEVLPLYNAGLAVPDDVTLVWPDDNFGYIRRLPTPGERKRSGGSGVYYHVSYWGRPQSYLWVESTPPGLIWEELHKAWQNGAGRLWVLNVGDLKPAEVAIDFYARLAWSPERWGPDAQRAFLTEFFTRTFGPSAAGVLSDLASTYYRLACVRRPDQITGEWVETLSPAERETLSRRYAALDAAEVSAQRAVAPDQQDAYFEMVGYAARMLATTGQLYLSEARAHQTGSEAAAAAAKRCMAVIEAETHRYNEAVAGGKWRHMMSITPQDLHWPADVGGTVAWPKPPATRPVDRDTVVVDGAFLAARHDAGARAWRAVAGLGRSGRAVTVLPATPWTGEGPTASYAFDLPAAADASAIRLHLLPTMRVDPAGHLRLGVALDGSPAAVYAVPGGESDDERSGPRREAVLTNRVTIQLPPGPLAAGSHTVTISGVDPGVVLDQLELPSGAVPRGSAE
jgi:hypothetical protein